MMLLRFKLLPFLCACVLALFVGACGGGGEPDPGGNFFNPGNEVSEPDPEPDIVEPVDVPWEVEAGPVIEPLVEIIGFVGLEEVPVLCANTQTLQVHAQGVDVDSLRMVIADKQHPTVLGNEPTVVDEEAGIYEFELDGSQLVAPEDVDDDDLVAPAILRNQAKVDIVVAALVSTTTTLGDVEETVVTLPTDERYFAEVKLTFDAEPPELAVETPSPGFELETISGFTMVEGGLSDNFKVAQVEVSFAGNELLTIDAGGADAGVNMTFEEEVDLRNEQTATDDFVVTGRDSCGFEVSLSFETKLIGWPWIRSYPEYCLPDDPVINGTVIVDWDEDGYLDVLFATEKGLYVGYNRGDEAPGEFRDYDLLTSKQTSAAAVADLDGDDRIDVVTISSITIEGPALAVYRNHGDGVLELTEHHVLPIGSGTKIRALEVADFDLDGRQDAVIGTDAQEESIVLFKRANVDKPSDFDLCEEVVVDNGGGGDDADAGAGDEADVEIAIECPNLFSDGVTSGGVDDLTQLTVRDVTGIDNVPDGYPDLIIGAAGVNQIRVFPNRFPESGLLDTAFAGAVASFVWPLTATNQDTEYFCVANVVEFEAGDGTDHDDLVVATQTSGTFRLLVGKGDGSFYWEAPVAGDYADLDIYSMSGAINGGTSGVVCADFNVDGHQDWAILSGEAQLMQVHLGDGLGRSNQLEEPLLNPINEGMGFVVGTFAQSPKVADFDDDGFPDILIDFRQGCFTTIRNRTNSEGVFDLNAGRALVTPLGKHGAQTGGVLNNFAIGDIDGDGSAEIIAATKTTNWKESAWLSDFHPMGRAYREWLDPDPQIPTDKPKVSPTFFVWGAGTWGDSNPSYPAAYDRMPKQIYGLTAQEHGAAETNKIRLVDIFSDADDFGAQASPDGKLDIVMSGSSKAANPKSHLAAFINTSSEEGFWDINHVQDKIGSMFTPFNGAEDIATTPRTFEFFTLPGAPMPGLVVTTNTASDTFCTSMAPVLRLCGWNPTKNVGNIQEPEIIPYWDCWEPNSCDDQLGRKFGGDAFDMIKIATEGPLKGFPDSDPTTAGDLLVLSNQGDNMTFFPYDDASPSQDFPFFEPINLAVGLTPQDIDVADIDGDELPDIAATVQKNVMLAFGKEPSGFEAFLPIDKRPGFQQDGGVRGVVFTDANADGHLDIAFTEASRSRLTLYLAVGQHEGEYRRQYHGPIYFPTCKVPTVIDTYDFNGDGCETLVVLCTGAGAVTVISNDTCAINLGD